MGCTALIPALKRQRQEDLCEFEASCDRSVWRRLGLGPKEPQVQGEPDFKGISWTLTEGTSVLASTGSSTHKDILDADILSF